MRGQYVKLVETFNKKVDIKPGSVFVIQQHKVGGYTLILVTGEKDNSFTTYDVSVTGKNKVFQHSSSQYEKNIVNNWVGQPHIEVKSFSEIDPTATGYTILNKVYKTIFKEVTEEQEFTSEKTSRKQVPALHRFLVKNSLIPEQSLVFDYGGGAFDLAKEFIENNVNETTLLVYDPFNRDDGHNNKVISITESNGGADIMISANVLNVIKEKHYRKEALEGMKKYSKPDAPLYISVYEAPKSKNYEETEEYRGQMTKDGWQNAQKIDFYLPEVKEIFPNAYIKNNIIRTK